MISYSIAASRIAVRCVNSAKNGSNWWLRV
jgi:hypothetical protein